MPLRPCRFCEKAFTPSRFHPEQQVCSEKACQSRRRAESRQRKLAEDAEYLEGCRESARQWRANHPDYWKRYRAARPEATERNRARQQQRDQRQRLLNLANNNSAPELTSFVGRVWLLGLSGAGLANNNLAMAQVVIVPEVPGPPPAFETSCKQQRSGLPGDVAANSSQTHAD
jgi:hypothetical protein